MRNPSRGPAPLTGEIIWIGLVVAVAGLLRGFTGFGAGLFMAPLLSTLAGPLRAVPLLILLDAAVSAVLVPPVLPRLRPGPLARLGLPAVAALPAGSFLLTALPPRALRAGIGLVVLATVIALAAGWRARKAPGLLGTGAVGAASGLLTGAAGIGGPPVILFHLSGPGAPPDVRAGLIGFFTLTQGAALALLAARGLLSWELLGQGAALAPVFLASAWAGAVLFRRRGGAEYRMIAYVLLAASALTGLASSLG